MKRHTMLNLALVAVLTISLCVGCSEQPVVSNTPTETITPTEEPTPTVAIAPTEEPTPTPLPPLAMMHSGAASS